MSNERNPFGSLQNDDDETDNGPAIPVYEPKTATTSGGLHADDGDDDVESDFDIPVFGQKTGETPTEPIKVGVAEYGLTDDNRPLKTSGVGSCLAVVVHDEIAGVSGLLHFMLPHAAESNAAVENEAKFADTGLSRMVEEFLEYGGKLSRTWAKAAGGAQMIEFSQSTRSIGERNVEAAREILETYGIEIRGEDYGGSYGRSITFEPKTGVLSIDTRSERDREL